MTKTSSGHIVDAPSQPAIAKGERSVKIKRLLYLLPVILFVVIALALFFGLRRDPQQLPSALLDRPAPQFDLPPLETRAEPLDGLAREDLVGTDGPKLVNVFASWCAPCRVEHPILTRLSEDGWTLHGVNYKDTAEDAGEFLATLGDPYERVGFDEEGRAGLDWGITGVPETFILDKDGTIVWRYQGPLQEKELREQVLPLLEHLREEAG